MSKLKQDSESVKKRVNAERNRTGLSSEALKDLSPEDLTLLVFSYYREETEEQFKTVSDNQDAILKGQKERQKKTSDALADAIKTISSGKEAIEASNADREQLSELVSSATSTISQADSDRKALITALETANTNNSSLVAQLQETNESSKSVLEALEKSNTLTEQQSKVVALQSDYITNLEAKLASKAEEVSKYEALVQELNGKLEAMTPEKIADAVSEKVLLGITEKLNELSELLSSTKETFNGVIAPLKGMKELLTNFVPDANQVIEELAGVNEGAQQILKDMDSKFEALITAANNAVNSMDASAAQAERATDKAKEIVSTIDGRLHTLARELKDEASDKFSAHANRVMTLIMEAIDQFKNSFAKTQSEVNQELRDETTNSAEEIRNLMITLQHSVTDANTSSGNAEEMAQIVSLMGKMVASLGEVQDAIETNSEAKAELDQVKKDVEALTSEIMKHAPKKAPKKSGGES